ncbi:MAG: hypothetical protein PG978_000552 [Wolbachia endosymbiont of Ctenocephalides felis wCfeF]|nr:MAG: hypothetical protein PG978_000552 [Wolbachia endosymbiont of Ctenocephalides felis wCfeF]
MFCNVYAVHNTATLVLRLLYPFSLPLNGLPTLNGLAAILSSMSFFIFFLISGDKGRKSLLRIFLG